MTPLSSESSSINRWWTVVAGLVGCAVGAGVLVLYTFGVFSAAMANDFGWSRTVHANSLTIFLVGSGIGSIILGSLIDRYGVRRPCALFVAVFGGAIAALSIMPAEPAAIYATFVVIGVSGAAATAMPYAIAVRGLFDRERGLALGLVNFGSGLGAALAPYGARYLDAAFGWRGGYLGVGLAALLPALGLIFLVRDTSPAARGAQEAAQPGVWLAQLKRRTFWLIAIPIAGISVATFGVMGSMVPLLKDRGIDAGTIAIVMSCAGGSSWLARLIVGWALDRFFGPYVAAGTFVLAIIGLGLIAFLDGISVLVAAAILIGFALGSEGDLVTFLVSRYFAPHVYSRVLGAIWVTWAWGGGIGTFLAGVSFEQFSSYGPALLGFAVLLIVSAVVVCRLGPYDYPPAEQRRTALAPAQIRG